MKNVCMYLFAVLFLLLSDGCTQKHYVSARPNAVRLNRPPSPGPGFIWVDGHYYWRGGRYQYRDGYWIAPRRGRTWRSGFWVNTPRGYYWRRGGWH